MTYEEYKSNKEHKSSLLRKFIGKLFTIIIFTMLVIIASNFSPKFRNFLIDDVLNSTFDFSKVNKVTNKITKIFDSDEVKNVTSIIDNKYEKYLDGIKYYISDNTKIYLKSSGIVTFIGEKEGYGNTVIVQQSDGYYAWYGNINESIKLYDYVESGSEIGESSGEYYYALFKDDKPVDIFNEN